MLFAAEDREKIPAGAENRLFSIEVRDAEVPDVLRALA